MAAIVVGAVDIVISDVGVGADAITHTVIVTGAAVTVSATGIGTVVIATTKAISDDGASVPS